MLFLGMQNLPDPRKIDLLSPDAGPRLDHVIKDLYLLRERFRTDLFRHETPINRTSLLELCSDIDERILLGRHALVAQTTMQAVGKFDLNKTGVLIYANGGDGWFRGEGDLEKKVCEYKQISFKEGNHTVIYAAKAGIENIGPQNIVVVDNPSSLLFAREKVGLGFSLLQHEVKAYHERARETKLATLPLRLFRGLSGKGFGQYFTMYTPLSLIDERRHAIIYAQSRSCVYWCSVNLDDNAMFDLNKSNIPTTKLFSESPEERSNLQKGIEKYHPGMNVFLAHNKLYPRFARMQMLDVMNVLHARYQVFRGYSESMAIQRMINMQPGQHHQT